MFKVGDVCRIRQWEDMASEFGMDIYEEIKCDATFPKSMRNLCGKEFVIAKDKGSARYASHVYESTDKNMFGNWIITGDMLEYADEYDDTDIVYDTGFISLICSDIFNATGGDHV